jgi:hypothetical protein
MIREFLNHFDSKIDDIVKVNAIGAVAFAVSWSDFDHWLRTFGLIAALVYTVLKITQTIKELKK